MGDLDPAFFDYKAALDEFLGFDENLEWFESRPEYIKESIRIKPPSVLYWLRNQKVVISIYDEPLVENSNTKRTCTVRVLHCFNDIQKLRPFRKPVEYEVFGVNIYSLSPICLQSDADSHRRNYSQQIEDRN